MLGNQGARVLRQEEGHEWICTMSWVGRGDGASTAATPQPHTKESRVARQQQQHKQMKAARERMPLLLLKGGSVLTEEKAPVPKKLRGTTPCGVNRLTRSAVGTVLRTFAIVQKGARNRKKQPLLLVQSSGCQQVCWGVRVEEGLGGAVVCQ
jgi:hypothetical protein